jgi:hypothetical protein
MAIYFQQEVVIANFEEGMNRISEETAQAEGGLEHPARVQ